MHAAAYPDAARRLAQGASMHPHDLLGAHPYTEQRVAGVMVRAHLPRATDIAVVLGEGDDAQRHPMTLDTHGIASVFLPDRTVPLRYRLEVTDADGQVVLRDDPYRFLPTVGEMDLHLINEGRHLRLWERLGAHPRVIDGVAGTAFAVWAPNAVRVSVVGDFNGWDARVHPMRMLGTSGVFELFIPAVEAGAYYKYDILTRTGAQRLKTDPLAFALEPSPGFASIVQGPSRYAWQDGAWLARRAESDARREPMLVYEVHLASWRRSAEGAPLTYREIAPMLAAHVRRLGFTHVELLPVQEHPFGGSWGYQVGGYFAPTSRFGTPDDFRFFVDTLHQAGIGVLLDWVPAHFPRDDWALRRFDGTACYEHEDPRLGDHPEWGTHIFNYARHEVRNFLLANALYWIEQFHLDGLRVDAVASMLYLDYGREAGQWLRNKYGGRENLEAVTFLRQLNHAVQSLHPGVITVAEESTAWPKVTHPIAEGGLGFTFKWNMGWMHDTLDYFRVDPFFRKGAHDKLTFAIWYEWSEAFVNPLSHDEVVHLKKSLLEKMPGDEWQRFANLRALIGYSVTRPGKSLFFMGTELAPYGEWNHDVSLPWHLLEDPRRVGLVEYVRALGALYQTHPCFWRADHEPGGYRWIDVADREQSVISFLRLPGGPKVVDAPEAPVAAKVPRKSNKARRASATAVTAATPAPPPDAHAVVVLNLTPVPRGAYRLGVPQAGRYQVALNSDEARFGGSDYATAFTVDADGAPWHGFPQSIEIALPPLSMLVLLPVASGDLAQRDVVSHDAVSAASAEPPATPDAAAPVAKSPRARRTRKKS